MYVCMCVCMYVCMYVYMYIYMYMYIDYIPTWRDSCYLDPQGEAPGMLNSMNPDK